MEFPLLLAEWRNRQSPALLQEVDLLTPNSCCFLGIEREKENTSVTGKERHNLQHSCMNTSAMAEKMGQQEIWVPNILQIPHYIHTPPQDRTCLCQNPKSGHSLKHCIFSPITDWYSSHGCSSPFPSLTALETTRVWVVPQQCSSAGQIKQHSDFKCS